MTSPLKSDADLKSKANRFFNMACNSVVRDSSQISEIFSRGGFRMLGGMLFSINEDATRSQQELVERCVKLLGSKSAHETEIENLAWDHVQKNLSDGNTLNIAQITADFVAALHEYVQRQYLHIFPNYNIRFQDSISRLQVGTVEALLADECLPELFKSRKNVSWEAGSRFEMRISDPGGIKFEFTPVVWRVSLQAAPGHIEEEATWLVNIAVSLLRLSYPVQKRYVFFPGIGEKELHPVTVTRTDKQGITSLNGNLSYGGISAGKLYEIDEEVIAVTESPAFIERAKAVFFPIKRSLGERFGQGLGWLARGRQSADRAERFLFFFTAIEALLSSDDKTAPVVQTIARYAAVILQDDVMLRSQLATRIKTLYAIRSSLVHAGIRNVSNSDVSTIHLVAESLYWVVMDRVKLTTSCADFHVSLSEASYGLTWMPKPSVSDDLSETGSN